MVRILWRITAALGMIPFLAGAQAPVRDSATIAHDRAMVDLVVTTIQSLRLRIGVGPAFVGQAGLTKIVKLSPAALKEVSGLARDSLGVMVTPASPAAAVGQYILFSTMVAGSDSATLMGRIYGRGGRGGNGGRGQKDGQTANGGASGGTASAFCIKAFLTHDVWYIWYAKTLPVAGEVVGATPPSLPPTQDPCKEKDGGG